MALITCPDCKKAISAEAQACPKCGRPITDEDRKKTLPGCGKMFLWILILGAAIGLGAAMCSDKEQKPKVENTAPAAAASLKTFDMKSQDFVNRFNSAMELLEVKDRLPAMPVKKGGVNSVNDVAQSTFEKFAGFTLALDKTTGKAKSVSLLGTPDGSELSGLTIMMAMGGMVMAMNPELDKAGRSSVLRDLGLLGGAFPEKSEIVRGNVRYVFMKIEGVGVMLTAEPM